jgi:hypothetical protein
MPLRTLSQLAADEGLSSYQVKQAVRDGLEYVALGSRKFIADGAWERFIAERTKRCQGVTGDRASSLTTIEAASTISAGPKTVAAGSAARALSIAAKLKSRSRSSSMGGTEKTVRVIPPKSS